MGTDIHGWIEISEYDRWYGIIRIQNLINRGYDMFGCLFGVKNHAGFNPVVNERGMPLDSSHEVKEDWWHKISESHTWIMWSEIQKIDWDEPAVKLDQRVRYYQKNANDEWEMYMKAYSGHPPEIQLDREQSIQIGNILYKVERMTRRDALRPQWELLFDMMQKLANRFGEENVRLVVWFDS